MDGRQHSAFTLTKRTCFSVFVRIFPQSGFSFHHCRCCRRCAPPLISHAAERRCAASTLISVLVCCSCSCCTWSLRSRCWNRFTPQTQAAAPASSSSQTNRYPLWYLYTQHFVLRDFAVECTIVKLRTVWLLNAVQNCCQNLAVLPKNLVTTKLITGRSVPVFCQTPAR